MSGSSTILQTLLPAKTGVTVQRGGPIKRQDQTFAAVFEKKIQVQQEKAERPASQFDIKDRQQAVNEQREAERALEKAEKTERKVIRNPAKEKMKELMKQVRDTLEALKNPDKTQDSETPQELLSQVNELNRLLEEIKILIGNTDSQSQQTMIESIGAAGAVSSCAQDQTAGESNDAVNKAGADPSGSWDDRQASLLKGNSILRSLEKVIEDRSDLIAGNKEVKTALEAVLANIKSIQAISAQPENQFSDKLQDLLNKLDGMVVKLPETKVEETAIQEKETGEGSSASTGTVPVTPGTNGTQNHQTGSEESDQPDHHKGNQAHISESSKNSDESGKTRISAEKSDVPIEKISSTAQKAAPQQPLQSVQNPQGFQDTLEAVSDGLQARGQLQNRIMEQVVESVKMNIKSDDGKSEMIMKLKPESLGNVALKVSIEKGIVLAEFQVESQAVKQALESNLQDLKNALQDKGFNVFNLDVSVRKDNQNKQNQQAGRVLTNRLAQVERTMDRMEQRLISLESVHRESSIDYLG